MAAPKILTYRDAVDWLFDYCRPDRGSAPRQQLLRAIQAAYSEVASVHPWGTLLRHGRLMLKKPYDTGTIAYDYTGGTYERQLTLTTGTWPSWAVDATVRIDDIEYDVATRESDSVLTLDTQLCPDADIAAGTTYSIYKRYYALPTDFDRFYGPWTEETWFKAVQVHPSDWMAMGRFSSQTGTPARYCIMAMEGMYGTLMLGIDPVADADQTLDIMYWRKPREIRYSGYWGAADDNPGLITVTAGSASVSGATTDFELGHVGTILRIGYDGTNAPTGRDGLYPFAEERAIHAWTSTTAIELDAVVVKARTSVKYTISDPIDLDPNLHEAFLYCCAKHTAFHAAHPDADQAAAVYKEALDRARAADCRSLQSQVAGGPSGQVSRLSDATITDSADVDP